MLNVCMRLRKKTVRTSSKKKQVEEKNSSTCLVLIGYFWLFHSSNSIDVNSEQLRKVLTETLDTVQVSPI